MFGLGYGDRFYDQDNSRIGYYTILYPQFILTVGEIPPLKEQSIIWLHRMMYNVLSDYEILRIQLHLIVDCFTCGYFNRTKRYGPHEFKFLQRYQDLTTYRDENHIFCLLRFGHYTQKHFFDARIQDNVEIPIIKDQIEDKEKN